MISPRIQSHKKAYSDKLFYRFLCDGVTLEARIVGARFLLGIHYFNSFDELKDMLTSRYKSVSFIGKNTYEGWMRS